jgi:hypothetical protein
MKKTWIVLLALLLLAAPSAVQAQFTYTTNNGAITLAIYTGAGGAVVISNFVTSIGDPADPAFYGCTGLTSITIPGSVTNIGEAAFEHCASLTSVTIPYGVISIGQFAFAYCSGLTSVAIPASVTSIGEDAFFYCTGLTTVTIFASATSLGQFAFQGCTNLTNVRILNGVTSIGDYAFDDCTGLTRVTIPASVTNIGYDVFYDCTGLAEITVDTSNALYSSTNGVLFDKSQTTLVEFPGGLGGSYAIPASVTNIGDSAFEHCFSLTSVTIPNSVTSIGADAFAGTGLTSVAIPGSVTSIGQLAFYYCIFLTSVTIPGSVTNIGNYAFDDCTSLTAITVDPNNVFYSSTNGVLFDKSRTTLVAFPGGIGGSYTIPASVTSIGISAFSGCSGLASVAIPGSVTSIGQDAFEACTSLASVYFNGNAPTVGSDVFFLDDHATVYYLPGTTGWSSFFAGCWPAPWFLPNPLILNNGPSLSAQNNVFGFTISWATNAPVVVEACTNLAFPVWTPLQTNALTNGAFYFSEALQTNIPGRYYRIRSP